MRRVILFLRSTTMLVSNAGMVILYVLLPVFKAESFLCFPTLKKEHRKCISLIWSMSNICIVPKKIYITAQCSCWRSNMCQDDSIEILGSHHLRRGLLYSISSSIVQADTRANEDHSGDLVCRMVCTTSLITQFFHIPRVSFCVPFLFEKVKLQSPGVRISD